MITQQEIIKRIYKKLHDEGYKTTMKGIKYHDRKVIAYKNMIAQRKFEELNNSKDVNNSEILKE